VSSEGRVGLSGFRKRGTELSGSKEQEEEKMTISREEQGRGKGREEEGVPESSCQRFDRTPLSFSQTLVLSAPNLLWRTASYQDYQRCPLIEVWWDSMVDWT
jgi:hypothetical protein